MTRPPTTSSLKVLFIGNSFTARNNLPALIAKLAQAAGCHLEHDLMSIGGASLRTHWNKGAAQSAIEGGKYNYVVLQEQSTLPIKNPKRMHENIRLFDGVIKSAGAKTALYLTWARQHAPETQTIITKSYQSIAEELGATIIPAGIAWQRFLRKHDNPALHDRDQSHPTLAGSFLAACVAYQTLFNRRPDSVAIDVDGLTAKEVKLLQRAAALQASAP